MVRTLEDAGSDGPLEPETVKPHTDPENFPNGHRSTIDPLLQRQRFVQAGYREILPDVFDDGESLKAL